MNIGEREREQERKEVKGRGIKGDGGKRREIGEGGEQNRTGMSEEKGGGKGEGDEEERVKEGGERKERGMRREGK